PAALLTVALVRARFCELLAPSLKLEGRELDLFLMGLLSALDALTDRPLAEIVTQIPLAPDVTAALLGANNNFGRAYALALAFERGMATRVNALSGQLRLCLEELSKLYQQSLSWADASAKI